MLQFAAKVGADLILPASAIDVPLSGPQGSGVMQTRPEDWGVAYTRFDKSAAKTVQLVFFVEGDVDSWWPAVADLDKI